MSERVELTVTTITNNWKRKRPRRPLVHLMCMGPGYAFNSFSFHPRHAAKIIAAIRLAAESASAGIQRKKIEIDIGEGDQP